MATPLKLLPLGLVNWSPRTRWLRLPLANSAPETGLRRAHSIAASPCSAGGYSGAFPTDGTPSVDGITSDPISFNPAGFSNSTSLSTTEPFDCGKYTLPKVDRPSSVCVQTAISDVLSPYGPPLAGLVPMLPTEQDATDTNAIAHAPSRARLI